MHKLLRLGRDNKHEVLRVVGERVKGLNDIRSGLGHAVKGVHRDDALLVDDDEPLLTICVAVLQHVRLQFTEALFKHDDLPVLSEAEALELVRM